MKLSLKCFFYFSLSRHGNEKLAVDPNFIGSFWKPEIKDFFSKQQFNWPNENEPNAPPFDISQNFNLLTGQCEF